METGRSSPPTPLVEIAFGCDAGYLQPLTIAISSVLTSARDPKQLRFWLVTKSLDAAALAPLQTLVRSRGATLETRTPMEAVAVERMPLGEHFTEATYYRLMMPEVLPDTVTKLIYLDSDVIVRHPIEDLWAVDLEGLSTGAVFNPRALNYGQMGLERESDYFNAGVLVMDLSTWRKQRIHQRALQFAVESADQLLCADQDAINHILAGAWKRLDLRWNQQFKFFKHSAGFLRVPWLELRRARSAPYIVHYSTNTKPWHSDNQHPWRDLYFDQLDRTHYRGWRPALPPTPVQRPRFRGGFLQRIAATVRGR